MAAHCFTSISVIIILFVAGCTPLPQGAAPSTDTPTPKRASKRADLITEAGKTLIQSKKGRQWLLDAAKVKWKDSGKQAHLSDVDWTLQNPGGKGQISVKAPGAEIFVDTSRVQFEGMVDTVRFSTGDHLWGRDFLWDGKKGQLVGKRGVRWARGTTVVTADEVTASDHLEHIHLKGHVKITTLMTKGKGKGLGF
jgi:hypothetical protein